MRVTVADPGPTNLPRQVGGRLAARDRAFLDGDALADQAESAAARAVRQVIWRGFGRVVARSDRWRPGRLCVRPQDRSGWTRPRSAVARVSPRSTRFGLLTWMGGDMRAGPGGCRSRTWRWTAVCPEWPRAKDRGHLPGRSRKGAHSGLRSEGRWVRCESWRSCSRS